MQFKRHGRDYFVAVGFEKDDALCWNATHPDKPAGRESWQRYNTILAMGYDVARVVREAELLLMVPAQLTLWFERRWSVYLIGPRTDRSGASQRPSWAAENLIELAPNVRRLSLE